MARRKLSLLQEEEIIVLYTTTETKSFSSISRKYGVGISTIKRVLVKNGIDIKQVSNKLSKSQEREVIDLYISNKKETLTSIGRYFGVSRGTIKRILKANNIDIEYDRSYNRNIEIDKHSQEIVDLFVNQQWSRNKIAKKFDTSHMVIRRVLMQNGIIEDNYFQHTNTYKIESMVKNLRKEYEVDFAFFESLGDIDDLDIGKIMLLNDRSKRIIKRVGELINYKQYIRKFYFDPQFNAIYDAWEQSGRNRWLAPSIDHKIPLANGGSNVDLNNLQFITWFENRAKYDMTEEEWTNFKKVTNTVSDFFIRK